MSELLQDATVVVTGGASGNGRAICRAFAEHGADVVVADVREEPREGGEPTHELVEAETDREATFVECDVTDRDDLAAAVDAAEALGGIDVMVNNAGIFRGEEFLEITPEGLGQFLSVNVEGVFFGAQVAADRMLADGTEGAIVNMSSIGAERALDDYTAYDATKGAVLSMTYSMADRLGPEGIRVNAIMPGLVETAMTKQDVPIAGTSAGEQFAATIPQRRFGQPEDVADAAVYLASDMASNVTVEALVIDGGVTQTN